MRRIRTHMAAVVSAAVLAVTWPLAAEAQKAAAHPQHPGEARQPVRGRLEVELQIETIPAARRGDSRRCP